MGLERKVNENQFIISVSIKAGSDAKFDKFLEELVRCRIIDHFDISHISNPILYFGEEIVDHILEHGFASLFRLKNICEYIIYPQRNIDELKLILERFVKLLLGAERLVIVDPYLYAQSDDPDQVANLFSMMISWVGDKLKVSLLW